MRVGLLGGAFDPPHVGHLICAQYTLEALQLDKILFIPSGDHPFKRSAVVAAASERLAMTTLAVEGNDKFEVSDIELHSEGITYTIDTIEYFQQGHSDWEIFLLIGSDNIGDFDKWQRYQDILAKVKVAVFRRSGNGEQSDPRFIFPDTPIIELSSTGIRQRVREGKSIRSLVTPEVEAYIRSNKLYR